MTQIDNGPCPGRNYGETAILQILHILASFLECKTAIFFKLFPKRQFTVYNAEIFFVTSYNPMAWVVKRAKLNFKKVFFWNTLVCSTEGERVPLQERLTGQTGDQTEQAG